MVSRSSEHAGHRVFRQEQDAVDLSERHEEWAGAAAVAIYRCEVDSRGDVTFAALAVTAPISSLERT